MNKLKELRLIVKMNERLGVETEQSVFDQIIAEEQKEQKQLALQEERKAVFKSTFADLSGQISKLMAEEKQKTEEEQALLDRFANVLTKIDQIVPDEPQVTIAEELEQSQQVPAPAESLAEVAAKRISEEAPPSMFVQPEPPATGRDIQAIQNKLRLLEGWVSKISMAGPGGGEVNLRYLDDVARETIADGKWLKYDAARKKFVFDDINPGEIVNNTNIVTGNNYTVSDTDWYIGVNYAGPVTITLPTIATTGRVLVIKDESGSCETYPITALGTVDNDAGGFILQINNGAIQMTYRSGWRVI